MFARAAWVTACSRSSAKPPPQPPPVRRSCGTAPTYSYCGGWRAAGRRLAGSRQPVDAEFDLVAGVVVGAGIERNVLRMASPGGNAPFPPFGGAEWRSLWLPVDGHHDGAIRTVFRPHPDLAVGAVGHDGEIGGVVVPLVDQLDAADRQGWVDRHRFGHLTVEACGAGAVLGVDPSEPMSPSRLRLFSTSLVCHWAASCSWG